MKSKDQDNQTISSNYKSKKATNQGYVELRNILEVETKTTIEWGLVMDIIIPLDIISITL